jgi:maleylacetate reductase
VPRVLFGRGAISRTSAEAEALGQRILFVCTPSLKNSAPAQQIRGSLGAGLLAEFNGVMPHVPREAIDAARRLATEKNVDVVVALGGGSAIGVGKGVALEGSPLIAIPTTYAGSEMTPVVGITDRREGRKRVERNPAALPRLAIYDPEVTVDLPPQLTASTAMNALAHCVEAVYARDANPIVPPVALDGIRRIVRSLPLSVADGRDLAAREDLLLGAYLAAFSIANARMALHHAICHVLGGRTGVSHGVLNAIVLPHVMQFNADAVPDAMTAIADAMQAGARTRDIGAAARATAALLESLPLPKRLHEAGIKEEILEPAAGEVAAGDTAKANPKPVGQADVLQILRSAW